MAPPTRPGRPIYSGGWHRPLPPQAWRPTYTRPLVNSFLGLTFGMAFNSALDYLYNGSYIVDGYGQRALYPTRTWATACRPHGSATPVITSP